MRTITRGACCFRLAAFGFLLDPIQLDVAIVFFGTWLLLFKGQIRLFLTATCTGVVMRAKALRARR